MRLQIRLRTMLLGGASALSLIGASATDANAAAAADAGTSTQIQEVVVTARRTEERLQDIPASVATVGGDRVAQMGQLRDIQQLVSGVTFQTVGVFPTIGIRGFGNRPNTTGSQSAVGIFQDGVFVAPLLQGVMSQIDAARIEVAKGPQSTLYGRASFAGALNIVSSDPTQTVSGYLEAGGGGSPVGNEGLWGARGVISGPLTDTLSARLFVAREERDGYSYDPVTHNRGNGYDRTTARIKFLWAPTDDLTVRLTGTTIHDDAARGELHSSAIIPPLGDFVNGGNNTKLAIRDALTFSGSVWEGNFVRPQVGNLNGNEGTLDVRYQTPIGELQSLTDYARSKLNARSTIDGTALGVGDTLNIPDETRWSQELRLTGKRDHFTYMGGVYYLDSDYKNWHPGATLDLTAPAAIEFPGSQLLDLAGIQAVYVPSETRTKAFALYAQVGYDITDQLNITGGLRYGRDKLTGSTAQFLRLASGPVITSVPVTPQAATFNATTGNVNVNYKITPDVLVYASYSRGDSPGGFNSGLAALEPFGPQNVDAYELGMKSMWLDHRLQLNMALFNNEYSNLQLSQNRNINGVAAQLVVNAAQARGRGFDMDGAAVLSSNWRLNWNYTYSESRITHYDVPPPTRLGLPIDLTGIPLVRSPKNSGNISITYNTDALGPGRLELTAAQSYTSSYINDYTGVPAGTAYPGRTGVPAGEPPLAPGVTTTQVLGLYSTKGYGLTSLNASYIVGRWEVSAYVRNLFNKQYIATLAALDTFTYPNEVPGEPRTWEIRLKYNF